MRCFIHNLNNFKLNIVLTYYVIQVRITALKLIILIDEWGSREFNEISRSLVLWISWKSDDLCNLARAPFVPVDEICSPGDFLKKHVSWIVLKCARVVGPSNL